MLENAKANLIDPNKINLILDKMSKRGYTNIRLFQPTSAIAEEDSLYFLVNLDLQRKDTSLFDEARFKSQLKEIIEYDDIVLEVENMLTEQSKQETIQATCIVTSDNIENIKSFLNQYYPEAQPASDLTHEFEVLTHLIEDQEKSPKPERWNDIKKQVDTLKSQTERLMQHHQTTIPKPGIVF